MTKILTELKTILSCSFNKHLLYVYYVPGIVLSITATFKCAKIPCFPSLKETQDREYLFPALLPVL